MSTDGEMTEPTGTKQKRKGADRKNNITLSLCVCYKNDPGYRPHSFIVSISFIRLREVFHRPAVDGAAMRTVLLDE